MNFLILHSMGPRSRWLASVADIELALPRYAPQHHYVIHNASVPLPEFIKDVHFDGIILNSSFIGLLGLPFSYKRIKEEYAFIRDSPAFTIALPQDDYWCSEVLDEWFTSSNLDTVHPVCSREHWNLFYPRYMKLGRQMSLGYTGYITSKLRQRAAFPKPHGLREYDVMYRAKGKPSFPNRIGNLKGQIGERFRRAFADQSLKLDISTNPKDIIRGDKWLDFVENSRSILGSNSGSSLLVRNHEVVRKIFEFTSTHPGASYEEIEQVCFPGEDGKFEFTAISPRNIEAGLLNTLQILVPGPYSGILLPLEHYVPLDEDCANIKEVMSVLNDAHETQRITNRCREALVSCREIQVENFVEDITDAVSAGLPLNHQSIPPDKFTRIIQRHKVATLVYEKSLEPLDASKRFVRDVLPPSVKNMVRRFRGI